MNATVCASGTRAALAALLACACTAGAANVAGPPQPAPPSTGPAAADLAEVGRLMQSLAQRQDGSAPRGRLEIEVGQLDPRLKLAPCQRVQPYLPAGQRAWGKVRVGLRCVAGAVPWNVYLPVTVRVWAPAVVAAGPIAADAVLRAADLSLAEVDIAEHASAPFDSPDSVIGRRAAVALAPGSTVRADVLKLRQWFGAGDTVTVLAQGQGFSVSGEAQALSPGLEGQAVRLRTDSGRIITGLAVGERRVELRP